MKLLFIIPSFRNGGTISSLINLLNYLNKDKYQVDILAIVPIGPNYAELARLATVLNAPANGQVVKKKRGIRDILIPTVLKVKKILCSIGIDISRLAFSLDARRWEKRRYDYVIGFQEGQATRFASCFKKTRKVCWIHCDYSNMIKIAHIKPEHHLYQKFEKIVCVSKYTLDSFLSLIPEVSRKACYIYNVLNVDRIITKSKEPIPEGILFKGEKKIVSIGRLDPVKRFEVIPSIQLSLKQKGIRSNWYIIGGGNEKEEIEVEIKKNGVSDSVTLLGNQNNPYPFIANASIVVCTSISEACPYVINEAKILHIPIISTDFGSAKEFINDNYNGIVVPVEQLAEAVSEVLTKDEVYGRLKKNINIFKYDNEAIIDKIEREVFNNQRESK